jgi:hypothetical protein
MAEEKHMRIACAGAISLALMNVAAGQGGPQLPVMPSTGGVGAVTQSRNAELTPEQKTAIAHAVRQSDRKVVVPPGVSAQVGSELPAALELYMLPDATLAQIPAAKLYKYTMVNDRVVLVDPPCASSISFRNSSHKVRPVAFRRRAEAHGEREPAFSRWAAAFGRKSR